MARRRGGSASPARVAPRGRRPSEAPPPPAAAALPGARLGADRIRALIDGFFTSLHRPVRKNLTLLVDAFVTLTAALRSGQGHLTLAAVARALPPPTSFKQRYKRLNRFLDNRLFDPQGLTDGLFAVFLGVTTAPTVVPVIVDQSALGAVQLLVAGLPLAGRILPLALMTFTYEGIQTKPERDKSQNFLERTFFLRLLEAAPPLLTLCFILDRGYARVSLMKDLLAHPRTRFIFRARRDVIIQCGKRGRRKRRALGRFRAPHGKPRRLERIEYRGDHPLEVDLVIYYERGHQECWYLVVPPGSAATFPTDEVVALYRRRMQIEQGFRDFKTHLGVRGLRLEVRISERVQRLLMAFTLAYGLVVALGLSAVAERARERVEDGRARARHGTTRILSARTVAALLLGGLCAEFLAELATTIARLFARTLDGRGLYHVAPTL
ncbi:MAG: transposase [Candidatus Rokubacteria bacterium]|nr:transposase [Candidatus Rokubacteria bacterium]MBI3106645.1 transposase [Candidatus Rokubacteria bacterium]